jgi:UDPglucose 6-dehydrogenase
LILTEWDEFKGLDFSKVKKLMKRPLIIDGRNMYEPERMEKLGFTYVGIGRGKGASSLHKKEGVHS